MPTSKQFSFSASFTVLNKASFNKGVICASKNSTRGSENNEFRQKLYFIFKLTCRSVRIFAVFQNILLNAFFLIIKLATYIIPKFIAIRIFVAYARLLFCTIAFGAIGRHKEIFWQIWKLFYNFKWNMMFLDNGKILIYDFSMPSSRNFLNS